MAEWVSKHPSFCIGSGRGGKKLVLSRKKRHFVVFPEPLKGLQEPRGRTCLFKGPVEVRGN